VAPLSLLDDAGDLVGCGEAEDARDGPEEVGGPDPGVRGGKHVGHTLDFPGSVVEGAALLEAPAGNRHTRDRGRLRRGIPKKGGGEGDGVVEKYEGVGEGLGRCDARELGL
jgi:hypothetical protein